MDQHPDEESVHDLAAPYAVDALDDRERAVFEAHLPSCRPCQELLDELGGAAVLLSDGLETPPPPHLRAQVLDQIAATPQGEQPAAELTDTPVQSRDEGEVASFGAHRERRRARPARWIAAVAAGAVVLAGGWGLTRLLADSPVEQVIAADDARQFTADTPDGPVEVITAGDQAVVRLPEDLPDPEEGSVYQAWFVGADGAARSAGVIGDDTLAAGEGLLEGAPSGAAAVGLTVEPSGGSEQPTTEPFIVVPLG